MKNIMNRSNFRLCGLILTILLLTGCQTIYYNTMEKFGYQKHEILVDRVIDARDEQQEAKEQFKTTLERFNEVVNFDGGELEKKYEILNAEYNRCESKAEDVKTGLQRLKMWAKRFSRNGRQNLINTPMPSSAGPARKNWFRPGVNMIS